MKGVELPPARVIRDGASNFSVPGDAPGSVRHLAARPLPRPLVWHLLFGGSHGARGWLLILFSVLLAHQIMFGENYYHAAVATVEGVEQTSHNPPFLLKLHFVDDDGIEHAILRYSGNPDQTHTRYVKYIGGEPERARLTTDPPIQAMLLILVAVPIAGIVFLWLQLRAGRRTIRLLRHGVPVWGKLVHQSSDRDYRGLTVILSHFQYLSDDGTLRSLWIKTENREQLCTGEAGQIFYDAADPECATLLSRAYGAPMFTSDGQFTLQRTLYGKAALILPFASAAAAIATVVHLICR